MKYFINLDMEQNEIKNALLHPLSSAPSSGKDGQVYFNKTDGIMYKHDGQRWSPINLKPDWNVAAGNDAEILNKPTKLSQFENDSEFITKDELDDAISGVVTLRFLVVGVLPVKGQSNIIYLVPKSPPEEQDVYYEYVWIENEYELIGSTSIDLDNYLQKDGDGSDLIVNGDRLGDILLNIKNGTIRSYTETVEFSGYKTATIQHNLGSTDLIVSGIDERNKNVWIEYTVVDENSISVKVEPFELFEDGEGRNVRIYILTGGYSLGGSLPTGGTTGQVLMKNSDADYDVKWGDQTGGSGGGSGKRYASLVVGTSTAGWTSNDCDFLCDGVDDQVEINQAIQSLRDANKEGEILILSGDYHLTAPLSPIVYMELRGMNGTRLIRDTPTGATMGDFTYMIGVQLGKLSNISYDIGDGVTAPEGVKSCEIVLFSASELSNCYFSNCLNHCVIAKNANFSGGGTRIYNNTFFSLGDGYDILSENSSCLFIQNNHLNAGISILSGSNTGESSFSILNNINFASTSGTIILNGVGGAVISGNKVHNIKVLNTPNNVIFYGNVIQSNILATGSDNEVLIELGTNTKHNIVSLNCLRFYNTGGKIVNNGTGNIVENNITFS